MSQKVGVGIGSEVGECHSPGNAQIIPEGILRETEVLRLGSPSMNLLSSVSLARRGRWLRRDITFDLSANRLPLLEIRCGFGRERHRQDIAWPDRGAI